MKTCHQNAEDVHKISVFLNCYGPYCTNSAERFVNVVFVFSVKFTMIISWLV